MINFCTLFDSNYLDKALAMHKSLQRTCEDFTLYVMCFDERSYFVLQDLSYPEIIPERLSDFETPELLAVKSIRSKAEYCWTCTPAVIEYFMDKYKLDVMTYIDADLYFFSNPKVLFDEIKNAGAHVGIMEHRFENNDENHYAGKYCVEFNYFDNSTVARKVLAWWKEKCLEWCFHKYEPETEEHCERYGDQKYLEQFEKLFEGIHVIENFGGGVAPWNLAQYSLEQTDGEKIILTLKKNGMKMPLIFYHYQNLKYISRYKVNINSQTKDKKLKNAIYYPYLREITTIRHMLNNHYNIDLDFRKSYSSNKLKAFIQKYIMPYKVKYLSDIINLKKIMREASE